MYIVIKFQQKQLKFKLYVKTSCYTGSLFYTGYLTRSFNYTVVRRAARGLMNFLSTIGRKYIIRQGVFQLEDTATQILNYC